MKNKFSKRFQALLQKVDQTKDYDLKSGVSTVKSLSSAKFDETVEVSLRLGVDPRHADQMIRGSVVLPHGTGKVVKVAVFAKDLKADEAIKAGADVVGGDDLVEQIKSGNTDFDIVIATPDMMPLVGKVGRILGPRGIMPNPKTGTVTDDVAKAVHNAKSGQVNFRVDKKGNIHSPIGKASFGEDNLVDNLIQLVKTINRLKPSTAKGRYIRSSTLSLTMSPAVRLDSQELMEVK